ncbi:precorrin-6A synthase (deacetylating) [Pseudonocardiaceae bacterium YIM PH 21723]|nr:precorrin-6A synthase (deacetylating) [Pseudonocardiaceae bacterium YIM PH 21723]
MRTVLLIGIGAGNPEHVTVQAVRALERVDVFFVLDKGEVKEDLLALRQEILHRYAGERPYRVVAVDDAPRVLPSGDGYREAVADWHARRIEIYRRLIAGELADGQVGGILLWGDPTLYDSTLSVLRDVDAEFSLEVIPGISSVSALVAAHQVPLNRIGKPVRITTGRRLAAEWAAAEDEDAVVMLDGRTAFTALDGDAEIFWGAYVGSADEILISGKLSEVGPQIVERRAEARERKGWLMDTYLLRRLP